MRQKILFISAILIYGFTGFLERHNIPFIQLISFDRVTNSSLGYLIFTSLLISTIFFIWFKHIFPKGYEKQSLLGLIAIFLAFSCVSFAIDRGWLFNLNVWFSKDSHPVQYVVESKYFEKNRRSKFYRVLLQETKTQTGFTYIVKQKKYDELKLNDTINLNFFEGYFKIKYCK